MTMTKQEKYAVLAGLGTFWHCCNSDCFDVSEVPSAPEHCGCSGPCKVRDTGIAGAEYEVWALAQPWGREVCGQHDQREEVEQAPTRLVAHTIRARRHPRTQEK
jgi:hypothetical protein